MSAVKHATDEELRSIPGIGQDTVRHIRQVFSRLDEGFLSPFADDHDLLDEQCFIDRNFLKSIKGVSPMATNSEQVLQSLEILSSSSDTVVEVIDAKIAKLEAELEQLQRLRKLSSPTTTRNRKPQKPYVNSSMENRIIECIRADGPLQSSVLAGKLGTCLSVVGRVVAASGSLAKDGKLVVLSE